MSAAGVILQTDFADGMAMVLGVDPNDKSQAEAATSTASASQQTGSVEFVNVEEGEQPIHDRLLQKTEKKTQKQRPPQALPVNELRISREGKRDLVFADMADTTRGRSWERTNRNKTSRSAHAARAAHLNLLDRLGRLPQRAFTEEDAEALSEARKETKPAL